MEIIDRWVESKPRDFKVDTIETNRVGETEYRVNVYEKIGLDTIVPSMRIAESYFLRVSKENVITDLTIKPSGIKNKF